MDNIKTKTSLTGTFQESRIETERRNASFSIPYIDPSVEHVGVSRLRSLNATNLRNFDKTLVIQDNNTPLAVLLSYDQFLELQNRLRSVLETLDVLSDEEEASGLSAGLAALAQGRTKPLSAIRVALKPRGEKSSKTR